MTHKYPETRTPRNAYWAQVRNPCLFLSVLFLDYFTGLIHALLASNLCHVPMSLGIFYGAMSMCAEYQEAHEEQCSMTVISSEIQWSINIRMCSIWNSQFRFLSLTNLLALKSHSFSLHQFPIISCTGLFRLPYITKLFQSRLQETIISRKYLKH